MVAYEINQLKEFDRENFGTLEKVVAFGRWSSVAYDVRFKVTPETVYFARSQSARYPTTGLVERNDVTDKRPGC